MIAVLTSHSHIWHPEQVVVDIIKEYQATGTINISLNGEGPCADTIGLYKLLEYVCEQFQIDPAKVKILTANFEERHPTYTIQKISQHWFSKTIKAWKQHTTLPPKTFKKLFGCLYNVPSWDRLCLLSYIYNNSTHQNQLNCNGTWEPDRYNTYYLNTLIDHAPAELLNVSTYLQTAPHAALNDVAQEKPITANHMMAVYPLYKDFFIDVVAETYNAGLSFFVTEKTIRPILALTPFIVNAPPGFLSTLRSDYGIITFDRWWSEDYDSYQGYERIQKMYQVIDQIDNLTTQEQMKMYQEMLPILEHNQQQLLKYE